MAPATVAAVRGTTEHGPPIVAWLVIAAGAGAFAFDEPPRAVLDAVSTSFAQRAVLRLITVLTCVVASGSIVCLLADGGGASRVWRELPVGVAVLALCCAAASVARRQGASRVPMGAVAFGPLAVVVISSIARRYTWLPTVADDRSIGRWWYVVLVAGPIAVWSARDLYRR